ncbi:hypothetical protein LuPra_00597 [Luteitalea pratensis]|uniref:Uncharacterized protein n=1 Tax=Luteitalea pratensis TaxID=1855912 RepID=A0A143PI33_LUTPR|nr:hypothetical protein [Luteitalea pratensis]AMY07424.1 hypothetical protein LuPra_00597 [Luteitalea pratensis]
MTSAGPADRRKRIPRLIVLDTRREGIRGYFKADRDRQSFPPAARLIDKTAGVVRAAEAFRHSFKGRMRARLQVGRTPRPACGE